MNGNKNQTDAGADREKQQTNHKYLFGRKQIFDEHPTAAMGIGPVNALSVIKKFADHISGRMHQQRSNRDQRQQFPPTGLLKIRHQSGTQKDRRHGCRKRKGAGRLDPGA